jgi:hypothetical protein
MLNATFSHNVLGRSPISMNAPLTVFASTAFRVSIFPALTPRHDAPYWHSNEDKPEAEE